MSRRGRDQRLALNAGSGVALYVINVVIAFVMGPVVLRALGNRDYGIWEMVLSLCGYLGIMEMGVGPAIIRYVAYATGRGDEEEVNRILSSALFGLLAVGVLGLLVFSVVASAPHVFLSDSAAETAGLRALLVIVGCSLCTQFVGTLFTAYLMGCQEHMRINLVRAIVYPAQAVAMYHTLMHSESMALVRIAAVGLGGNVVQFGAFAVMVLRRHRVSLGREHFRLAIARSLYAFGANSMILMVSDRVQRQSLPLVIGHALGPASVVYYAMPKRLVDYARDFVVAMCAPLVPYFTSAELSRNEARLAEWLPASRAVYLLIVPGALLTGALGETFVARWLGAEYGEAGRWVIILLAAAFLVGGPFANASRLLVGLGAHGRAAKHTLILSIVAVAVAVPCTAKWGVTGSAGVLAASEVVGAWIFWREASPRVGVGTGEHLLRTAWPVAIPGLAMLAVLIVAGRVLPMGKYFWMTAAAVVALGVYIVTWWIWGVARDERRMLRARFSEGLHSAWRRLG